MGKTRPLSTRYGLLKPTALILALFLLLVAVMVKKTPQASATSLALEQGLAPETFTDGLPLPKMLVFDLDYTLWPFWVDTHVSPPLKAKDGGSKSVDKWGESFTFYREIPSLLSTFKTHSIPILIGTASRTAAPDLATTLLKQLMIKPANKRAIEYFDYMQIFPGDKKQHFAKIQKSSGITYEDMLFFDDEVRNRNVETLGVTMCLVRDGLTRGEVDRGVREWRRRHGLDEKMES